VKDTFITSVDYRKQAYISIVKIVNSFYSTIKKPKEVAIHPSSALFKLEDPPRFVLYFLHYQIMCRFQELVYTTREYIRIVSEVDITWLKEIAPHYYNNNDLADESKKKMPKMVRRN
jgi:pre-mRNA-splicing factor ATP-dependent RNA helicase DHX16